VPGDAVGSDKKESTMKSTTIAVDLAKAAFEVALSDRPGHAAVA